MSEGLEDDEKDYLLKQNPNLMPLFMINLEKTLENKEVTPKEKPSHRAGKRITREEDQESIETQAKQCKGKDLNDLNEWIKSYEQKLGKDHVRVKANDLHEVNLGEKDEGRKLKIRAELE